MYILYRFDWQITLCTPTLGKVRRRRKQEEEEEEKMSQNTFLRILLHIYSLFNIHFLTRSHWHRKRISRSWQSHSHWNESSKNCPKKGTKRSSRRALAEFNIFREEITQEKEGQWKRFFEEFKSDRYTLGSVGEYLIWLNRSYRIIIRSRN